MPSKSYYEVCVALDIDIVQQKEEVIACLTEFYRRCHTEFVQKKVGMTDLLARRSRPCYSCAKFVLSGFVISKFFRI